MIGSGLKCLGFTSIVGDPKPERDAGTALRIKGHAVGRIWIELTATTKQRRNAGDDCAHDYAPMFERTHRNDAGGGQRGGDPKRLFL